MRLNWKRTMLAGFVGTLAMTILMYLIAPRMGVRMDIAGSLAGMLGMPWSVGLLMHFINGTLIFPLLYAAVLFKRLKGGRTVRGMTWGVALWLIAQLVVMPMIGAGVFSSKMGGVRAAVASLMAHLIYGTLLGAVAGSPAAADYRGISTVQA
jgi:uncharacterized membrane protein YagU involved in acid resistance